MSEAIPTNKPEKEVLDDNARKFIVEAIDTQFLSENITSSYTLTVDWLATDADSEKKIAYKEFDNGDIQILLISKITKDGNRISEKEKITEEKYKELLPFSMLHLEKKRYEFTYTQDDISFSIKYDEFADSTLRILEVDTSSEVDRNSFNPSDFPSELSEVTGNIQYYGYRVAGIA